MTVMFPSSAYSIAARPASNQTKPQFSGLFKRDHSDFSSMSDFDASFNRMERRGNWIKRTVQAMFVIIPLLTVGMIGTDAYNTYRGQPTVEDTIGRVQNGPWSYSITKDHSMINNLGFKTGSFDADGNAYDAYGQQEGYVKPDGTLIKITTSDSGLRVDAPIGRIDANGNLYGYDNQHNLFKRNLDAPGLTFQEKGAAAIVAYF